MLRKVEKIFKVFPVSLFASSFLYFLLGFLSKPLLLSSSSVELLIGISIYLHLKIPISSIEVCFSKKFDFLILCFIILFLKFSFVNILVSSFCFILVSSFFFFRSVCCLHCLALWMFPLHIYPKLLHKQLTNSLLSYM